MWRRHLTRSDWPSAEMFTNAFSRWEQNGCLFKLQANTSLWRSLPIWGQVFSSSTFLSFDEQELIMNEKLKNVSPGDIFLLFSVQGQRCSPLILVDCEFNVDRFNLITFHFYRTKVRFFKLHIRKSNYNTFTDDHSPARSECFLSFTAGVTVVCKKDEQQVGFKDDW